MFLFNDFHCIITNFPDQYKKRFNDIGVNISEKTMISMDIIVIPQF